MWANTDLAWVDDQIEAIKPPRVGINNTIINALNDPIVKKIVKTSNLNLNSNKTAPLKGKISRNLAHKPLTLEAIINGSAYVNGNWYHLHDTVRGQKITAINEEYIILSKQKKETRLFVNPKNSKIKITTR